MTIAWTAVLVIGFTVALLASRRAVIHASALALGLRVPPFLIGATLLAIGTDLPEIANSIVASVSGHGDINVGDSIGSSFTQVTLILGLLPFLGGAFIAGRARVLVTGALTVGALGLGAFLLRDGFLSRSDGILLVAAWLVSSVVVWRNAPPAAQPAITVPTHKKSHHAVPALGYMALVAAGATAAVQAFVHLAESFSVPEYLLTFFVASIGTSLPELMVDVTALKRGQRDLAIGDIFGSSLVDATLSLGIGPVIAPTLINSQLAVRGSLFAMAGVAAVVLLLSIARRHDWKTGVVLLGIYAALYLVLLG
jgi:cation:H+ antiporter